MFEAQGEIPPCKSEVNSDGPYVMSHCPDPVLSCFPAMGTTQTLYATTLLPWLRRYHASMDGNATSFRNALSESRADFWYRRGLLYLQWFGFERARRSKSQLERAGPYEEPPAFWPAPPYEPSRYFWARQYLEDFERRRAPMEEEIQKVYCERVLRVDHTGAAARRMRNAGGKWVANIMNESNKIAAFALVPSDAKAEIAKLVRGIRDRQLNANVSLAPVVYVDKNCCSADELRFWRENWSAGCAVKLDVFHFLQRITNAVSRRGGPSHVLYSTFCADLVECVYCENKVDFDCLANAIARAHNVSIAVAGNTARKREDFRKFVRRAIPDAAELERRMVRLLDAYRGKADGNGHLVLHEDALQCFQEQLKHARNGCVSDPDWGAFVQNGEHTFRGDGGAVSVPMWRMVRGTSQIEGFHPTQAGTISGTNVGPQLGNAQLLEAAVRWNRKMDCRSDAHADVHRADVLRGISALQMELVGESQLPTEFDPTPPPGGEEFGVEYLLQGLGADLGATTEVNWAAGGSLRKRKEPAPSGLSKVFTPYPVNKTPEMLQAFSALSAESSDPDVILRLYRERYYAPSEAVGPGATGYFLTNIVFVKKWLKQSYSAVAARAVGTAEEEVARSGMLADFRRERPESFGSSWAHAVEPCSAESTPSAPKCAPAKRPVPTGGPPKVGARPSTTPEIPAKCDTPGPAPITPKNRSMAPLGAPPRGCKICSAAYADVFHPSHARLPGKRHCPNAGIGYVDWLRRSGLSVPDAAAAAEEEERLASRRADWEKGNCKRPNRPGADVNVGESVLPSSAPRKRRRVARETTDEPPCHTEGAQGSPDQIPVPPATPSLGRDDGASYACARCSRSFDDWYHPTHRPSGKGFYCPLTEGCSFGEWVNRRLRSMGKPSLDAAELDEGVRAKENTRSRPALNGREFCLKCRKPLAQTFHAGCRHFLGWRHCPEDGDFAECALAVIRARGVLEVGPLPSLEMLRVDRAAQEARWSARKARANKKAS